MMSSAVFVRLIGVRNAEVIPYFAFLVDVGNRSSPEYLMSRVVKNDFTVARAGLNRRSFINKFEHIL